ncbi:MYCT-like protein [Mya arenaria]|uniref:MYCT-like protein n=1 Tax=Mya arenaria TaxID=6604 RepID=A0ABY7G144_MYAAR|nr:MYCT-like protein [Mya arenaria]
MTCNDCMMDLSCGYCFVDNEGTEISNSSCLPTGTDNPWVSGIGQCNQQTLPGKLTWAYDYCPSPFSWMPMVGLVLYLVTFAPAISVATFTNWTFNPLVSITFITLTENLTRFGNNDITFMTLTKTLIQFSNDQITQKTSNALALFAVCWSDSAKGLNSLYLATGNQGEKS